MNINLSLKSVSFRKLTFLMLFTLIALVALKINFSQVMVVMGSTAQYFTFFEFFGPIAGAFLGPVAGVASVLFAKLVDFFVTGKAIEPVNILRLLPMLFAAVYFAVFLKKGYLAKASVAVPVACMVLFWLQPIGREAWYYALFWAIPIIAKVFSKKLFLRSLGATFTAHAIGSVVWVWSFPTTAQYWTNLIPITTTERVLFALGISVSFIAFNNVLAFIEAKAKTGVLSTEKNYLFGKALQ